MQHKYRTIQTRTHLINAPTSYRSVFLSDLLGGSVFALRKNKKTKTNFKHRKENYDEGEERESASVNQYPWANKYGENKQAHNGLTNIPHLSREFFFFIWIITTAQAYILYIYKHIYITLCIHTNYVRRFVASLHFLRSNKRKSDDRVPHTKRICKPCIDSPLPSNRVWWYLLGVFCTLSKMGSFKSREYLPPSFSFSLFSKMQSIPDSVNLAIRCALIARSSLLFKFLLKKTNEELIDSIASNSRFTCALVV